MPKSERNVKHDIICMTSQVDNCVAHIGYYIHIVNGIEPEVRWKILDVTCAGPAKIVTKYYYIITL